MASESTVSRPSRLGNCGLCEKNSGKYKCPCCLVVSCSLQCTLKHKQDDDCDGIRSKTAFLKVKQFTSMDFLNDYRLLEEIAGRVDSCERDKLNVPHLESAPMRMYKLRTALLDRGTRLILLPMEFEQRKTNTSYFDWKSKTVSWRIQLNFLNAKKLIIHQDRCSENMVLQELIEKYLIESTRFPESVSQKLSCYRFAGVDGITVLMKTEKVPLSDKKFYKLDIQQTLKENFVGKIIVEFPKLFILINGFFKTEKTKLEHGGLKEEKTKKTKNLLLSAPEKPKSAKPPPRKRVKVKEPTDSSSDSDSDEDWDDTEHFFTPWYRDFSDDV